MLISSIMMQSASSGCSLFRSKRTVLQFSRPVSPSPSPVGAPVTSKSRCMVFASRPVASVILAAARPVGAASRISAPSASKQRIIALMVVVLPVPGPPVITSSPDCTASSTARRWVSSSTSPVASSSSKASCSAARVFFAVSWMSSSFNIAATCSSIRS